MSQQRTCLTQLSQLLQNTLNNMPTLSSPSSKSTPSPSPHNTGLILPFPPRQYRIPPLASAFAPSNIRPPRLTNRQKAEALVEYLASTDRQRSLAETTASTDGTSWELRVADVDGWDVGWEKSTQMFVKRKGRGAFRFEGRVIEGWGVVEEWESESGRDEKDGGLEDGFEYRVRLDGSEDEDEKEYGVAISRT
ncbi:uncharacterized protein K460DRAFT_100212 [Cucurbitaria berberidis CBS 394.84]|uniref:Uncharacterized protein n=1 Tax=Cucurbitaria berberidis CBS 394.84 TaxID=1168544 RepID=A0A9P4GFX3_9PLEO|nr:uncharacterized protein K460DRAFT_100212 [Cucurbitaria berberidis CBS 394.84]KAF1844892.1 hypothetical protein K460DRAFT_100212 [Cucurbitaria berberidis CBS 394.84]